MIFVSNEADLKALHKVKDAKNTYKVPLKQWRKWSELARRVFNLHFYELKINQAILCGTTRNRDYLISKKEWRTQSWNAAWLAADSVMDALKEMSKCP